MSKIISAKGVLYAVTDWDQDDSDIFRRGNDVQIFASRKEAREFAAYLNAKRLRRADGKRDMHTIRRIECRVTW